MKKEERMENEVTMVGRVVASGVGGRLDGPWVSGKLRN